MSYHDLIELEDDAAMIDLGVASLETEGGPGSDTETVGNMTFTNVTAGH